MGSLWWPPSASTKDLKDAFNVRSVRAKRMHLLWRPFGFLANCRWLLQTHDSLLCHLQNVLESGSAFLMCVSSPILDDVQG